ncbi:MAG: tRNA (adenosine(37)-N6)-threonylcarbamoyltransferase complex transferase subunit TsaD [Pseudomonadota bacterium]
MIILGLETSCDETAAGLVRRSENGAGEILSGSLRSQIAEHMPFGGVVPEIAARAHVTILDGLIQDALQQASITLDNVDAIAATAGPGLLGGLLVGVITGKTLASVLGKPYLAINHLEAHALTVRLTDRIEFPYLMLLVSGGHTQILSIEGVGVYKRLATTIDDALGEAFDKVAKLLGLGFPGGPEVEKWAARGNASRFSLPRPMKGRAEPHFSFSGLKTAVRQQAHELQPLNDQDIADLCASFQLAASEAVADRLKRALDLFCEAHPRTEPVVAIAGGVAANRALSAALQKIVTEKNGTLIVPPPQLCTDNGIMIAWAGAERMAVGVLNDEMPIARARWPLDANAEPVPFAGVKA